MKKNLFIQSASCLFFLAPIGVCQAAEKYKNYTDEITCGETTVIIQSTCEKAVDDMSLNACKPQKLKIGQGNSTRMAALPELNQDDIKSIKEEDGSVGDLYVIEMGCVQVRSKNYAILYYSIGGGSAPYSELWTAYDESGKLLESNNFPLHGNEIAAVSKRMKKVHSIMPE